MDGDPTIAAEDRAYEEAARFMLRRGRDAWSEADERTLEAWLAAAPAHRSAWDEVHRVESLTASAVRTQRRRRSGTWSAIIVLLVAGLGALLWLARDDGQPAPAPTDIVYATAVGERRALTLPDGSRAHLDGASRLRWLGTADRRRTAVLERGRVHLAVVHRPDAPFRLRAGTARIEVLGTAFEVDLRDEGTAVAVASGAVRVDRLIGAEGHPVEAVRLEPGQGAVVGSAIDARQLDPGAIGAWRGERLVFDRRPLASVLAELERYHDVRLIVGPGTRDRRLTASIPHAPLERQLATIAEVLELRIVRRAAGEVVLEARPGRPGGP